MLSKEQLKGQQQVQVHEKSDCKMEIKKDKINCFMEGKKMLFKMWMLFNKIKYQVEEFGITIVLKKPSMVHGMTGQWGYSAGNSTQ